MIEKYSVNSLTHFKKVGVLTNESIVFLEEYINTPSPVGYEGAGQDKWIKYISPFIDELMHDDYGSVVAVINPGKAKKVVIEAHADEIAWYISYITDDGFLHIVRNGGSDSLIAPSKVVNIITKDSSIIKGVIGWPAIHVRKESTDTVPKVKDLRIDIGCTSKAEVLEKGIHVGCIVVFDDRFMVMNDEYFVGRALDNRIGGFIIAEVARQIKQQQIELPYSLYIVNSVQEEVGYYGAKMAIEKIKPNIAIVTDVCHDTQTTGYDKATDGDIKCGNGPVLSYAPSVFKKLLNEIIKTAEGNKIPFQRLAGEYTGTDTDVIAYSNGGTPSALISIPLKYMHTTVETAAVSDVVHTIDLFLKTLKEL